jgi:hypothetical protein
MHTFHKQHDELKLPLECYQLVPKSNWFQSPIAVGDINCNGALFPFCLCLFPIGGIRSHDLASFQVTPLITQLTYEGLIDELFGIRHSSVKLPAEKFTAASSASAGQDEQQGLAESRPATKQAGRVKCRRHLGLILRLL